MGSGGGRERRRSREHTWHMRWGYGGGEEIQQDRACKKKAMQIHQKCITFLSECGSVEAVDTDAKLSALQKVVAYSDMNESLLTIVRML